MSPLDTPPKVPTGATEKPRSSSSECKQHSFEVAKATERAAYPRLESETRSFVDTSCAAFHLLRAEQTLRIWACKENGPIRPIRINGRLAWPTQKIRELLGVE